MSIAKTIKQFLDNKHLVYRVHQVQHFETPGQAAGHAKVAPDHLYYPTLLRDEFGLLMAVLPASRQLDYQRLTALFNRKVEPAFKTQLSSVFPDCDPGLIPPVGEAYGIRTILDASIATPDRVFMTAGDHVRVIELARRDFLLLQTNAWLASEITRPADDVMLGSGEEDSHNFFIRQRIQQIQQLPAMPDMAIKLLKLRADPEAALTDLVEIVERDPSLTAQLIHYAQSPFFGFRGRVDSVHVAVARVLGFDAAINLAMGVALARPLRMPAQGPLGLEWFWRHSFLSAAVFQSLAKIMPAAVRPPLGLCYLTGLLHDFGYLVLGHFFREEFIGLSDLALEQSDTPIVELERQHLDIDHAELGAWLLRAWRLPEEVIIAARYHHDADYDGPHWEYVQALQLIDCVLNNIEVGRAPTEALPQQSLVALGISEFDVMQVVDQIIGGAEALNDMARRLAA